MIATDQIYPNPWNPNKTSSKVDSAIRESIHSLGFIIPIVVRPHPQYHGMYQLIDGEHRLEAAMDMEIDSIPAVVVDLSDIDAKKFTIIANETRGKAEPLALAELLGEILNESDDPFLGLPYNERDVEEMIAEADRFLKDTDMNLEIRPNAHRVVLKVPPQITTHFIPALKNWVKRNYTTVTIID